MARLLQAVALLWALCEAALAISFQLPANSRKCLREEIHKDVLVTGEYDVSEPAGQGQVLLKITDSANHILYSKEDASKGKFAFTTEEYDMFEVCFESKNPAGSGRVPDQMVVLGMKHGVEATNYEEIAKVEKLKPLEVELRRLEDLSESIVNDFAYMKKREEEMRDTNESTNVRVLYFSIFSMCCLMGLATWQVFYLRRFFKAKKLIE
ncbi:transmembrane emp24 domain-containing protein 10 [Hyperolius riggenbachi]|uniref:transmembrane emp24 domain-containing protein 10 n=1 Tax=Hyperolius riggenbachi TaxID=752182 RepID=UPI0035A2D0D3